MRIYVPKEEDNPDPLPIQSGGEVFRIPSSSDPTKMYTVSVTFDGKVLCTCPGYQYRDKCKHQRQVLETIANRTLEDDQTEDLP